jgi:hypothetical protein
LAFARRQLSFITMAGGVGRKSDGHSIGSGRTSKWVEHHEEDNGTSVVYTHLDHPEWRSPAMKKTGSFPAKQLSKLKTKLEKSERDAPNADEPAAKRAKPSKAEAMLRAHFKQAAARGESQVTRCPTFSHVHTRSNDARSLAPSPHLTLDSRAPV